MIPHVHILATGTWTANMTLVFPSLRVGFPTATVTVHARSMGEGMAKRLEEAVAAHIPEAEIVEAPVETHGYWMDEVLRTAKGPVVFLDTDVVFHEAVEHWQFDTGLAGRFIRRFREPLTRCVSEPRLHPSLLFVHPVKLARDLAAWQAGFKVTRFNPPVTSFAAFTLAERTRAGVVPHFHDTGSALYQAVGGTSFSEAQLDAYDHLFAGTFVEELAAVIDDADLLAAHRATWENPVRIRGAWRRQNEWFKGRAC
jgi:hypothetical protein